MAWLVESDPGLSAGAAVFWQGLTDGKNPLLTLFAFFAPKSVI
ncbi:hypothetical protein [Microcoleus sp. FACHB-672]|nr:hypothetical protein [Microcoleus sp. FACHB-672]